MLNCDRNCKIVLIVGVKLQSIVQNHLSLTFTAIVIAKIKIFHVKLQPQLLGKNIHLKVQMVAV